jgi:glycyl-tRNA synthetase beta subunit
MSYGKVINGGAQMRKGVSKGVNDKLSTRSAEDSRRQTVATAVGNAYKVDTLSSQHTNNVNGGKFQKPSVPKNI